MRNYRFFVYDEAAMCKRTRENQLQNHHSKQRRAGNYIAMKYEESYIYKV